MPGVTSCPESARLQSLKPPLGPSFLFPGQTALAFTCTVSWASAENIHILKASLKSVTESPRLFIPWMERLATEGPSLTLRST